MTKVPVCLNINQLIIIQLSRNSVLNNLSAVRLTSISTLGLDSLEKSVSTTLPEVEVPPFPVASGMSIATPVHRYCPYLELTGLKKLVTSP